MKTVLNSTVRQNKDWTLTCAPLRFFEKEEIVCERISGKGCARRGEASAEQAEQASRRANKVPWTQDGRQRQPKQGCGGTNHTIHLYNTAIHTYTPTPNITNIVGLCGGDYVSCLGLQYHNTNYNQYKVICMIN